ncbi:hypothetical protein ACFV23_39020, partial [Streptomyces sp. NPDC059627]
MTPATPSRVRVLLVALTAVLVATTASTANATSASATSPSVTPACGAASPGFARCFSLVRTDIDGGRGVRGPNAVGSTTATATATALPGGYGPADLDAA